MDNYHFHYQNIGGKNTNSRAMIEMWSNIENWRLSYHQIKKSSKCVRIQH
jgi:hypothetical protein